MSHSGQTKNFDLSEDCKFNTCVAAWYSDVTHAVAPVTNGYRIALIFNLIVSSNRKGPPNVAAAIKSASKLTQALALVKASKKPVAFVLDGGYAESQKNTGFNGLDRYRVTNLVQAAEQIGGIAIYSSTLDTQVDTSGWDEDGEMEMEYDDDGNELDECDFNRDTFSNTMSDFRHLAGPVKVFPSKMEWFDTLLTFGDPARDLDPYETKEEYTGNEGVDIEKCKWKL